MLCYSLISTIPLKTVPNESAGKEREKAIERGLKAKSEEINKKTVTATV
jgi:hypothetical protein